MIFVYIAGSFIGFILLNWLLGMFNMGFLDGPNATSFLVFGSIMVGILLNINDQVSDKNEKENVDNKD
ncbi:hypothetical protein [Saccharibacillus sp. JS10]|uniref:hypothetical protein n=1 Tax=Saccharibacillus sp. JS10 TaxID=2950552 RepID=UPI00210A433B|nr:hypothetical protein [Saccharibacillus sp. JS10]MCQ4088390.1 hypothetical protein [Saccharibacillus sp. JS10]